MTIGVSKQMLIVMDYLINPKSTNGWRSRWKEAGGKAGRQTGRHTNSLTMEQQLTNIEEMLQLENHHLVATTLSDSGKNPQRIQAIMGKSLTRNRTLTVTKCFPYKTLLFN